MDEKRGKSAVTFVRVARLTANQLVGVKKVNVTQMDKQQNTDVSLCFYEGRSFIRFD
jgi:hypothetical protein